jgi:hypothetical protein
MRIARIAVAAPKLAPPIRIDAPDHPKPAFGDGAIQNAANLKRLELDEVALIGVFGSGGEPGNSGGLLRQNRKE